MRRTILALALLGLFVVASCKEEIMNHNANFVKISEQYIEDYLSLYPETATSLGDHRFDNRLNDYSLQGVERGIELSRSTLKRLQTIDPDKLSKDNRVDYHILENQLQGALFRAEQLHEHEWNPLVYNVGGAIYYLLARDFAPIEQRLENVNERLKAVPEVVALAKANLKNPPRVHTETAIQQNQGTISLIENELESFVDQAPQLRDELEDSRRKAVDALTYYGSWLENDLLPESNGEFRLGEKKFRKKLGYVLQSSFSMEDVLGHAEAELKTTQDAMYETALPLYRTAHPGEDVANTPQERKRVIRAVLDALAENKPTNETIVDQAEQCLERVRQFTMEHELVSVPDEPINLIVMPEFQRGVAVAYCDAPGPLEPKGKTFFAISPTPADWTEDRVESFFREYNNYMLEDLTVHEGIPGHYLQLAHSNRFKAPTMIRAVFYSGSFVEGWATYAEQLVAEFGYGGPEVKMQQLKMRLRLVINAIIDQKIHTAGMTEEEAIALMTGEGFQEEGEAVGKWRRACLTSTQLSTYFVGNLEVNAIRKAYEEEHSKKIDLRDLHDEMLSFGSPPAKYVREMMGL